MDPKQIHEYVSDGNFFRCTFVKQDGTIREMTCRTKVHKYVKGTGKPITDGRLGVWEPALDGDGKDKYRSVWPTTIMEMKVHGETIHQDPYCALYMKPKRKK